MRLKNLMRAREQKHNSSEQGPNRQTNEYIQLSEVDPGLLEGGGRLF